MESGGKFKKEIRHRFNKGLCTAGCNCKYDHRCEVKECGKFGHGAHMCRKRLGNDQGPGTSGSSTNTNALGDNNQRPENK